MPRRKRCIAHGPSERARVYRQHEHLEDLHGTAVTVQAMVFGNRGLSSGAGVAFSRDPSTGAAQPVVDVLFGSQGEDVVSGSRTPETEEAIVRSAPAVATQLRETLAQLEHEFADVQDVEFTIEEGKLWILQTRSAKRTPQAALRFAIDFVKEGLITPVASLTAAQWIGLQCARAQTPGRCAEPAARGTGASAGIAVGRAAFDSGSAERLAASGDPGHPGPARYQHGRCRGLRCLRGNRDGHWRANRACGAGRAPDGQAMYRRLCGAHGRCREPDAHELAGAAINEGDWLSIDGEAGAIYLGQCRVVVDRPEAELAEIERWRTKSFEHS